MSDPRSFWQSRMTVGGKVAPLPELTDLAQLAAEIRARHKQVRARFDMLTCGVLGVYTPVEREWCMGFTRRGGDGRKACVGAVCDAPGHAGLSRR